MFCTQCGQGLGEADRFCGACGHPRAGGAARQHGAQAAEDWSWEASFNYSRIIGAPAVQRVFDLAQRRGTQSVGLTDFVDLLSPVLPVSGSAVFGVATKAAFTFVERTSLAHEHELPRAYDAPPGLVVAALACALAGRRYNVQDVRQNERDVTILAVIPPTLLRNQYVLEARIHPEGPDTALVLVLKAILGGLAKGRSRRAAEDLFTDVERYLEELAAHHP